MERYNVRLSGRWRKEYCQDQPHCSGAFLVYASVASWERLTTYGQSIAPLPQLQQAIEQQMEAANQSLNQPLPFLLTGQARKITCHVMDKPEEQMEHNPKLHQ